MYLGVKQPKNILSHSINDDPISILSMAVKTNILMFVKNSEGDILGYSQQLLSLMAGTHF